ncbi:2-polyprenylphenol 6-hydroxylase [Pikeienuella piscinae]|uniref:2-polyprenylphenol 6-hydroxylase n=1 Tax=Pikeienuella piscinae TaxID=2748098 RepID=A0A7L5C205_9RHOB|nr:2-polyprenylphenol 6-hydroxylase [Pikeienuella piscinae]QIE55889.1 2-polyprenylphenol 6-hydroxylase [Pikeienuella piscinae]
MLRFLLELGPNLWRLARVAATFRKTGAMERVLEAAGAPRRLSAPLMFITAPGLIVGMKGDASLPPVARAINALGPAYIKLGQILSTRPDVIGPELARDMRTLQDKLPPFPMAEARKAVRDALGREVEEIFAEFAPPIAAASIAQVHPAIDRETGRKLAVKILRPAIEKQFRKDIAAFHMIARIMEWAAPQAKRLRPRAVVDHFEGVVAAEMDLRLEASAASEFADNVKDDEGFRVPDIIWPLSARRVMTAGWVEGVPIGEPEALAAAGHDLVGLAERVIQIFLLQALRDGFWHADMHQGNLKIAPNGDILALDFGIMGRIDRVTRRYYAEILLGFLKRDYHRVAEVHFEAGYVPADRDVDQFAQALRAIGEPIFGQDASRISMARLLSHLFEVTERFGMETQTQLILLQRSMVVVEGVARSLDPNANIWSAAGPVVELWMRDNLGPKAVLRDARMTLTTLSRIAPRLPELAERLVRLSETTEPVPTKPNKGRALVWLALGAIAGAGAVWLTLQH